MTEIRLLDLGGENNFFSKWGNLLLSHVRISSLGWNLSEDNIDYFAFHIRMYPKDSIWQ